MIKKLNWFKVFGTLGWILGTIILTYYLKPYVHGPDIIAYPLSFVLANFMLLFVVAVITVIIYFFPEFLKWLQE